MLFVVVFIAICRYSIFFLFFFLVMFLELNVMIDNICIPLLTLSVLLLNTQLDMCHFAISAALHYNVPTMYCL